MHVTKRSILCCEVFLSKSSVGKTLFNCLKYKKLSPKAPKVCFKAVAFDKVVSSFQILPCSIDTINCFYNPKASF